MEAPNKYLLVLSPRVEIVSFILDRKEEDGTLIGHTANAPNTVIRVVMPYPVFDSVDELIEYYENIFETIKKIDK